MEILIAKKYKIIKKISQGAFGEIFHAININNGQQLAVKLEKVDAKYPQLIYEAKILTDLLNNSTITDKGIPNMYFSGKQGDYNAMVMDLLGQSLQRLLQKNGGTFSLKTTLLLFQQMIKRLEYIHSRDYLHRDIKPQNFVMGIKQKKQRVFLIDFGLSKKYVKNKLHIPYAEGKSMIGTVRYASVNTHLGIEPTRRDDLESLIYVICYLLYGRLPWQGQSAPTLSQQYSKILAIKVENKPQTLFKNLPQGMKDQFIDIFKHIRGLKFDQKPNYEMIKLKIRESMNILSFENDYIFDWTEDKPKENLQRPVKAVSVMKNMKSSSKYTFYNNNASSTMTPKEKGGRYQKSQGKKQSPKKQNPILGGSGKKEENTLLETLQRLKVNGNKSVLGKK